MAQSLSAVYLHIIFSTRYRKPLIRDTIAESLWSYLGGCCRGQGCVVYAVGGIADHVHIACSLPRTLTQSDLIREIKSSSSKWMRAGGSERFAWQGGFAAFSFGESQKRAVEKYIRNQREHHRVKTFQQEVIEFLREYKVSFDEAYLWD